MNDDIQRLINNKDKFAELITGAKLSKLSIDIVEIEFDVMLSWIVTAEKNQFNDRDEAYSAMFKRYLFAMEDWEIWIESRETDEEWKELMKNKWIPEYFFKWGELVFQSANVEHLISRVKGEFIDLNKPDPKIDEFIMNLTKVEAILVKKGHVYEHFFGESDSHYFIYDWGIYD